MFFSTVGCLELRAFRHSKLRSLFFDELVEVNVHEFDMLPTRWVYRRIFLVLRDSDPLAYLAKHSYS